MHLAPSVSLSFSLSWNSSREYCSTYISPPPSLSLSFSCSYCWLPLPLPLCLCSHFPPPSVFSLSTSPVTQGDGGRKADAFLFYLPVPAGTHLRTPEEETSSKQYMYFPANACETTWTPLARNFHVLRTDFHPGPLCTELSSNKEIRKRSSWSPAFHLTLHWELQTFSELTGGQFWCFLGDKVVLKHAACTAWQVWDVTGKVCVCLTALIHELTSICLSMWLCWQIHSKDFQTFM